MALDVLIGGANLDAALNVKTALSNTPAYIGGVRNFSENDAGLALSNVATLVSPEVDQDFRLRVSSDTILDDEDITYTAQNFTKHYMAATSFVPSWTATGFNTNPTAIVTGSAAAVLKTYKTFSLDGTETLSLDLEGAFSAAVVANNTIEFGFGLTANTTTYDCFDGLYIRANSTGLIGVIRNNLASDVATTAVFKDSTNVTFVPVNGRKYQFIIYMSTRRCQFWIADPVSDLIWLAGSLSTPAGYGAPTASQAVPIFVRQVHAVSAPATAASFNVSRYNVRRGGPNVVSTLKEMVARVSEGILSPGTLTTTGNNTITSGSLVAVVAAVPVNTAALLSTLSGKITETMTLAAGTDGILINYLNPALPVAVGTTYNQNRRLRINGISLTTFVSVILSNATVIAKGFYLAYGSTSPSLAGVATDTATAKAYRRVQLPFMQQHAINAALWSVPTQTMNYFSFETPIYVNPGEYVALVTTNSVAAVSGAVVHAIAFNYSWE